MRPLSAERETRSKGQADSPATWPGAGGLFMGHLAQIGSFGLPRGSGAKLK